MAETRDRMTPSKTEASIIEWVSWTWPLVYLAVWAFVSVFVAGPSLRYVWILLGLVYVAMHLYERVYRGHVHVSADETAVPVTAVVGLAAYFVAGWMGETRPGLWLSMGAFTLAIIAGHIVVVLYSFVVEALAKLIFRRRISEEMAGDRANERD